MKPVRFSEPAEQEFSEAALYLENARPGHGVQFRNAVYEAKETISNYPAYGEKVPHAPCRQVIVPAFPYCLIDKEEADSIEIIAVAHHKRRPGYWKNRLK